MSMFLLTIAVISISLGSLLDGLQIRWLRRDVLALTAELERLKQQDESRWARLNRSRSQ